MKRRFGLAVVGGTFDHFHKGHEAILSKAFEVADRVLVGVTDDKMARMKPFSASVEPFSKRKRAVAGFIAKNNLSGSAKITKIHDAFGPAAIWKKAGAIVVTKDTVRGARAINAARKNAGLPQAKIIACPFVKAEDNRRISSSSIRLGQMDAYGKVFLKRSSLPRKYLLTKQAASRLKRPFGHLFAEPNAARKAAAWACKAAVMVAVVGDVSFRSLSKIGVAPDLAIIDGKTLRNATGLPRGFALRAANVSNPQGQVTRQLILLIKKAALDTALGKAARPILVFGEEDLAVLPAILALPLGSVVLYGQPKKGVVAVAVDEKSKAKAAGLLARFNTSA